MPLNCTLEVVKLIDFRLCMFYQLKIKEVKKQPVQKKKVVAEQNINTTQCSDLEINNSNKIK